MPESFLQNSEFTASSLIGWVNLGGMGCWGIFAEGAGLEVSQFLQKGINFFSGLVRKVL
jgi:hypothetical protein